MHKPTDPNVIVMSIGVQGHTTTACLHPWSYGYSNNVESVSVSTRYGTELSNEALVDVVPILTGIPLEQLKADYRVLLHNPVADTYQVFIVGKRYLLGDHADG